MEWQTIDWTDPAAKISKYFTVREAIYLSRWGRLACERDGLNDHVKAQICRMAVIMDQVHELIGLPIIVHRWFSPRGYNAVVGGAKASRHMCEGDWSAVDWHAQVEGALTTSESCTILRAALEPKLEELQIRMEKNPGRDWIHLDNAEVILMRYFRP